MRVLVLLCMLAGVASADRVVAVLPLSTLGAEDTSASTKKTVAELESALAALPGTKVVKTADVVAAIKKANKPALKACEGEPACIAEIGKLVNATIVVGGEVGGLGASTVIYLSATDVASGKELRSTTYTVGKSAQSAVIQLLDPDQYKGTMHFTIDVTGAKVQIDGEYKTLSATGDITMPVGTHAVRVTHPQYHDFAKFVEVDYGKPTNVDVGLQAYPMIKHDIQGKPTNTDQIIYDIEPPLYRRWYVAGPAIIVLAVGAGILAGVIAHGDTPSCPAATCTCRQVGGMPCP
jgi:hypothetical protein